MSQQQVTHVGFSDESNWNVGRFRSLGLVTVPATRLEPLEEGLRSVLSESHVREFQWKKLKGAKERFAAEKLCEFALTNASADQLRVDVLLWDIEDTRHKIAGRDDIANLERMYYHLFRNVLRARWPGDAVWRLHPDEHTALDWETVQDCLTAKSTSVEVDDSLFSGGRFRIRLRREFGIEEIRQVSSENHPLLQLADLFAGLAVFSWGKYVNYEQWCTAKSAQRRLFDDAQAPASHSRSESERFQVLKRLDEMSKKRRFGVSLRSRRGLWTANPKNPINFWMYEPQHAEDVAPRKRKS